MKAKVSYLDDLMEKLDEAGETDLADLRSNQSDLQGNVNTLDELCASFGL